MDDVGPDLAHPQNSKLNVGALGLKDHLSEADAKGLARMLALVSVACAAKRAPAAASLLTLALPAACWSEGPAADDCTPASAGPALALSYQAKQPHP